MLHYTTTRLGDLLDRSPGNSVVAYLYRWRQCGFNKKHQSTEWLKQFPGTEQVPVSAYVGSSKNLKDLKDLV